MAQTFTFVADTEGREVVGRDRELSGTLTTAGTYATGGDVFGADPGAVARVFGLARFDDIEFTDAVSSAGYLPRYDVATKKLLWYECAAAGSPAAQAAAADTTAGTIRCRVRGK